jgi:hypothetical protein
MKRAIAIVAAALAGIGSAADLPAGLSQASDLRGTYRAALCQRPDMGAEACARTLRTYAGEVPAARPPPADPARYRLLFVPGFLASCFPGIHSFADVIEAARGKGYAADILAVGGRNGVAANARLIAQQIERLPDDGRRIVLIGHSKGAADALQVVVERPDLAARIDAVLTVSGALLGSPLAEKLDALYQVTLGVFPFSACDRGEGAPVTDLTLKSRADWWAGPGGALRTPVYSIVALPDLDRLSPAMALPWFRLAVESRANDGQLLVRDQVSAGGHLLGVVNADHLTVGIPFPGNAYLFVFRDVAFARPQVILAAIDVIASR